MAEAGGPDWKARPPLGGSHDCLLLLSGIRRGSTLKEVWKTLKKRQTRSKAIRVHADLATLASHGKEAYSQRRMTVMFTAYLSLFPEPLQNASFLLCTTVLLQHAHCRDGASATCLERTLV